MKKKQELDFLVVDDEKIVLKVISKILDQYDVTYECYQSPDVVFDIIEEKRPKVVLLDYYISDKTADQIMVKVSEKALFKGIEYYLMTGRDMNHDQKVEIRTLGIIHIISKPITEQHIEFIIKEALGRDVKKVA